MIKGKKSNGKSKTSLKKSSTLLNIHCHPTASFKQKQLGKPSKSRSKEKSKLRKSKSAKVLIVPTNHKITHKSKQVANVRKERKTDSSAKLTKNFRKSRPTYLEDNSLYRSNKSIKKPENNLYWKQNLLKIQQQSCKLNVLSDINELTEENVTSSPYTHTKQSSSCNSFIKNMMHNQTCQTRFAIKLQHNARIQIVDWVCLVGAQLLLKRQTIHLSIHYIDSFFDQPNCSRTTKQLILIASAAMLLSVKQQERQSQSGLLKSLCQNEQFRMSKESIIEMEKEIILKMKFKLKCNTLAFWIDYFSLKWDQFLQGQRGKKCCQSLDLSFHDQLILLRDPEGLSYKYYRQLCELVDIILFFTQSDQFDKPKLALASLFLVIRIQTEDQMRKLRNLQNTHSNQNQNQNNPNPPASNLDQNIWYEFHKRFTQKVTPIFKDPLRINQLFNEYVSHLCSFEMSEIVNQIKYVSKYIDLQFSFSIDSRAYKQCQNYEDFIRFMTYSHQMKIYALSHLKN